MVRVINHCHGQVHWSWSGSGSLVMVLAMVRVGVRFREDGSDLGHDKRIFQSVLLLGNIFYQGVKSSADSPSHKNGKS